MRRNNLKQNLKHKLQPVRQTNLKHFATLNETVPDPEPKHVDPATLKNSESENLSDDLD